MKQKYSYGILTLVLAFALFGIGIIASTSNTVEVTFTSVFDNDNVITNVMDVDSGSKISFDDSVIDQTGYLFVFWVVNGVVMDDLPILNEFTVTEDMDIQAIFQSQNLNVALFVDYDGTLLDIQFIEDNNDAVDPVITYPSRVGMELSDSKWDESLIDISTSTVFVLQYDDISDIAFVSISDDLNVEIDYYLFEGDFYVPENYELIEFGMIGFTELDFDLDTVGIVKEVGVLTSTETNKFTVSFYIEDTPFVRSYLQIKDNEDTVITLYSDVKGSKTVEEIEEFYSTSFEDSSKTSYDLGVAYSNGESWTLDDALIGSLANDQKDLLKSVRLRVGSVSTGFAIDYLYEVSFSYGMYLGDSASVFSFEISSDLTNWITIDDSIAAGNTFDQYEYIFTDDVYTTLGLDPETAYYLRFSSSSEHRVNLDDFYISQKNIIVITAEEEEPDSESDSLVISMPTDFEVLYELNDTFVDPGCTAIDIVDGDIPCLIDGSVDTTNIGAYEVVYYAYDYEGKIKTEVVEYIVFRDLALLEVDYTGYYDGIEGLYGEELLLALRTILNTGLYRTSYDEARYLLDETDIDPSNPDNVLTIYSRTSVSAIWDEGDTWNREHVWPNSRLGVPRVDGSDRDIASDLHNLRACISAENSSRSNDVFTLTDTASTFFPGIADKGDVSRILFYMVVMYDGLELVNDILPNDPSVNYTPAGAKMSVLDYLVTWHYEDTVDAFEVNRNEVIYSYQFNRNPFIDIEYLAELIWYDHVNIPES